MDVEVVKEVIQLLWLIRPDCKCVICVMKPANGLKSLFVGWWAGQ
jgi:hypothetical protein